MAEVEYKYTKGEIVTLTAGQTLSGASTVANIDFISANAYARVLTNNNATVGTINVSAGGTMFVRGSGAKVTKINVYGPYTYTVSGGMISSSSDSGGALYISGGSVGSTTIINHGQAWMSGGEINKLYISKTDQNISSSVNFNLSGGSVGSMTILNDGQVWMYGGEVKNLYLSKTDLNIGSSVEFHIYDGVVSGGSTAADSGAKVLYANGGLVSNFTMNANMSALCSDGGYIKGGTFSGGLLAIRGGTVEGVKILNSLTNSDHRMSAGLMSGCTIVSGASYTAIGGTAIDTLVSGSKARFRVSGAQAVFESGAVVSGGSLLVSKGLVSGTTVGSYGYAVVSGQNARAENIVLNGQSATVNVSGGGVVSGADISNCGKMSVGNNGFVFAPTISQAAVPPAGASCARLDVLSGGLVSGGTAGGNSSTVDISVRAGGVVSGMEYLPGAYVLCTGGTLEDCVLAQDGAQQTTLRAGALLAGGTATSNAVVTISSGTVSGTVVKNGAHIYNVNGTLGIGDNLVEDVVIGSGGTVTLRNNASGALCQMSGGAVKSGGTLVTSNGGVAHDVLVEENGVAYTYSAANFSGGQIFGDLRVSNGGKTSGALIQSGGIHQVFSGGSALDTVVSEGGALLLSSGGAAVRAQVLDGGAIYFTSGAQMLVAPEVAAGACVSARLFASGAAGVRTSAIMDDASNFNGTLIVDIANKAATYTIASEVGNTGMTVAAPWLMFDNVVTAGSTYVNPFISNRGELTVTADGKTLTAEKVTITGVDSAASLFANGDVINGNDRAAIWDGNIISGGVIESVAIAEGGTTGDAWLVATNSLKINATLFGTAEDQNFAGNVNYYFQEKAKVQNFAAGANYGGSVGGVNLLVNNASFTGAAYAGGFGTVENDVNIQISNAATDFRKNFYAGALYNANKVDEGTTTSVGDIVMTVVNGTFGGNIYGASAVKAGTITTVENQAALHTVGDVTLTIGNGTATDTVCVFAGGYATGHDTAKAAPVYTVGNVTATIADGSWGQENGGRGVFGGAFAGDNTAEKTKAGVWAQVGDVDLTIAGGTMGSVYGGGWAQKGALSEVGDVTLTISGGTITNVFGGGSTSKSGGSTVAGDVTITISGGSITDNIFARGQGKNDSVNSAAVVFTGNTDYNCNVYGYTYVGGEDASDATLSFSGYTGTFTGEIGGFADVTLDGNTKLTFANPDPKENTQTIINDAWTFDLSDRDVELTGDALLTWDEADFAKDIVKVNFADADQAAAGWSIAAADFTGATFDLCIDGKTVAADIAYDTVIADGDWEGWKFTSVNGTLKFAKIAEVAEVTA